MGVARQCASALHVANGGVNSLAGGPGGRRPGERGCPGGPVYSCVSGGDSMIRSPP